MIRTTMDNSRIAKSNVEQGTAAWIHYLKQARVAEMFKALNEQKFRLDVSLWELEKAQDDISTLVESNRGGKTGLHGFIAEVAERGIQNANSQIRGVGSLCYQPGDNRVEDLYINGTPFQMKFAQAGGKLSLGAVKEYLDQYPFFVKQGGKFIIPKDHYDRIVELFRMPAVEAGKLSRKDYNRWKEIHQLFDGKKLSIDDLRPSVLNYDESQKQAIAARLEKEQEEIRNTNNSINKAIRDKNRPTLSEAAKATGVSAIIEGGAALVTAILKKKKDGKLISDLTEQDWRDVFGEAGYGSIKGATRGAGIYLATNYSQTPAAAASGLVTAMFGVAENMYQYRQGKITKEECVGKSEEVCLSSAVSALSSLLGQTLIPIPVIGPVIGNTIGNIMYQTAVDSYKSEIDLAEWYSTTIKEKTQQLNTDYQKLIATIEKEHRVFCHLLDECYADDCFSAFVASWRLAIISEVPDPLGPHNRDDYFL